jgi:hypothetical protein
MRYVFMSITGCFDGILLSIILPGPIMRNPMWWIGILLGAIMWSWVADVIFDSREEK